MGGGIGGYHSNRSKLSQNKPSPSPRLTTSRSPRPSAADAPRHTCRAPVCCIHSTEVAPEQFQRFRLILSPLTDIQPIRIFPSPTNGLLFCIDHFNETNNFELSKLLLRETYTEAERDTYTEERHKEGEQEQDARGREGERGTCTEERGTECARETYTEEESDKETTQKQKATQKQKEEDEEAWVGGGVH